MKKCRECAFFKMEKGLKVDDFSNEDPPLGVFTLKEAEVAYCFSEPIPIKIDDRIEIACRFYENKV